MRSLARTAHTSNAVMKTSTRGFAVSTESIVDSDVVPMLTVAKEGHLSDFESVTDEGVATFRGVPVNELMDDDKRTVGFQQITEQQSLDRIYGREKQSTAAVMSDMPYKHASRSVNITKFNCFSHSSNRVNMERYWVTTMPEKGWPNNLMGWTSTADPFDYQGPGSLPFPSLVAAVEYCKNQGFRYTVDDEQPLLPDKGNDYTSNFLGPHIQKNMKKLSPKRVMNTQYKHAESGKSCWVNVKHTPHGKVESKMVSGTQWKDTTSPHEATWGAPKRSVTWEGMRKVGK